ncbi:MAG: hypothetical protein OEY88_01665 [Candidatus Bathyarchaeota archaeon]|nr:hypothetical protein [Candidatus Bathyarchaeota archaeon]
MSFFIEPFLGVLAAFGLGRLWDWIKDRRNKGKLKENLRNELEKCMNLLTGEGKLLPTMMWNSTVTSGDVKLLSFDERTNLSSVYFDIENHNYEAKRVRDSAVIAQTGPRDSTRDGKKAAIWHWERLSKALIENEKVLKQQISELLKESWWK